MKAKKSIKNSVAVGAAFALALGLVACSTSEEPEVVEVTQVSDGGGDVSVSDGGGAEVEVEEEKQMPDVIAAIEPPDKADYPDLGGQSRAAANDHARYFVDTMLYGYATGDSTPFSETFEPVECDICRVIKSEIDENKELKVYFDNYPKLSVNSVTFMGYVENEEAIVLYEFIIPEHLKYANSETQEMPGQLHLAIVTLKDFGSGWVILDVESSSDDL